MSLQSQECVNSSLFRRRFWLAKTLLICFASEVRQPCHLPPQRQWQLPQGFRFFELSPKQSEITLSLSLSLSLHISLCISFHTLCIYYTHVGMPISYILYIYVFILPMKSYHIYLSFVPSIYSWLLKGIRKWVLKRIQVEAVAQRAIAAMDRAEEEATVRGTRGLDFQALMFVKGEVESCESCLLVQEIREIHDCIRFPFVPNLSQLFLFSVGPP